MKEITDRQNIAQIVGRVDVFPLRQNAATFGARREGCFQAITAIRRIDADVVETRKRRENCAVFLMEGPAAVVAIEWRRTQTQARWAASLNGLRQRKGGSEGGGDATSEGMHHVA